MVYGTSAALSDKSASSYAVPTLEAPSGCTCNLDLYVVKFEGLFYDELSAVYQALNL